MMVSPRFGHKAMYGFQQISLPYFAEPTSLYHARTFEIDRKSILALKHFPTE